jgi:hypothetical protein
MARGCHLRAGTTPPPMGVLSRGTYMVWRLSFVLAALALPLALPARKRTLRSSGSLVLVDETTKRHWRSGNTGGRKGTKDQWHSPTVRYASWIPCTHPAFAALLVLGPSPQRHGLHLLRGPHNEAPLHIPLHSTRRHSCAKLSKMMTSQRKVPVIYRGMEGFLSCST